MSTERNNTDGGARLPYRKPAVIYHDKVEVLAIVCDSDWIPTRVCKLQGESSCQKIRL